MTTLGSIAIVSLGVTACAERAPARVLEGRAPVDSAPEARDSLALGISGGAIWFTLAREARGADGSPCLERTLEVRRGSDTVAIPLLYTRDIPTLLDDTTASARVYRDCAPGDRYRFDLRSGQPVRMP